MLWFLILTILGFAAAVPDDICDQTFDVLVGQTRTVNYLFDEGVNYAGNTDCTFHLTANGAERMRISFLDFEIEKHSRCNFDYLKVYAGMSSSGQELRKLCGYDRPIPIDIQGNAATLRFVSDRTVHKKGFILQFTSSSVQQFTGQCHPPFTKSTGSFQSPLYPNNYPNRVNCTYEISPAIGNQILIQFPVFQIERSSYCVMDYVTIKTRSGQQIGNKLCGDLGGNSYLIPGSHAIINFVSDRSSTRRGFEILYKVVGTCKELDDVCSSGCSVGDDNMLECACRPGYEAPLGENQCYDINECETDNGGCEDHCKNTEGSYECECFGEGLFLSPDKRNCTDRTCAVNNAGCEHNCHLHGNGAYFCTCDKGFSITADGHNCTDIDECNSDKYRHGCEQLCVNEPGSYYCDCGKGYTLSSNRRTCDDVDECVTNRDYCEQLCTNYDGGWSCDCYEGYQVNPIDSTGCMDINECAEDIIPAHCNDCANFEGGFTCAACDDGFVAFENGTGCADINECETMNGGCQQECLNTPGSYQCGCYGGQELVVGKEEEGACRDINECAPNDGRGPCEHYCENSVGSFQCHCIQGFEIRQGSGIACQDINECDDSNGGCGQVCKNSIGSYACSCYSGYWMIDGSCTDIDECVEDKPCDKRLGAICTNLVGDFRCECPEGYAVVNKTICQDVDECANGTYGPTHGCPQQCVNTEGSFRCQCYPGYANLGNNTCVDLNECSQSLCDHNELCVNTHGSFTCGCRSGYFLLEDGTTCSDTDECAGEGGGSLCSQVCHNLIGSHKCGCYDGYELTADNYTCNDINECTRNISGCSDGCTNFQGFFQCYCHQGYVFAEESNTTCVDKDECEDDNGGCHHVCSNSVGSFSCSCRDGYQAGSDARCHDIDECATDNGGCGQHCHNFNGTYNCTCDPDFKLGVDNHTCSNCPTCESFENLQTDVANLLSNADKIKNLVVSNMQLASKVAVLEDEIERFRQRLDAMG